MRLDLEADGAHPDGIPDALLPVYDIAARNDVQDLARVRDRHGAGGLDRPERVLARHVVLAAGHGDHPAGVLRPDVHAGDPDERGAHLEAREPLRRVHGGGHGLDGAVDVDHDALPETVGGRLPDPDDVDAAAAAAHLTDEHADLGRTDVDRDEHGLVSHGRPPSLTLLLLPTCVRVTARSRLKEMAPDYSDVLEDAPAEREQGHEIEVDPEAVTQERERGREERVGVEARQEDAGVEVSLELGAKSAEKRVERREDPDRRIARPLDR